MPSRQRVLISDPARLRNANRSPPWDTLQALLHQQRETLHTPPHISVAQRAAPQAKGQSARTIIAARIALETKRMLAHTDRLIYLIAFGQSLVKPANFGKYFQRGADFTPVCLRNGNRG